MKWPMTFSVDILEEYPYRFRFDLVEPGPMPMHQIPSLRNTVNKWLVDAEIEFDYKTGLLWCLKNEQDAMMFKLRFA